MKKIRINAAMMESPSKKYLESLDKLRIRALSPYFPGAKEITMDEILKSQIEANMTPNESQVDALVR